MNEKAQRRAIAESMGWAITYHGNLCWDPKGAIPCIWSNGFDPLKDLNACAAIEKSLDDLKDYTDTLKEIVWLTIRDNTDLPVFQETARLAYCATAAQRCGAWLRVKGLWKEDAP